MHLVFLRGWRIYHYLKIICAALLHKYTPKCCTNTLEICTEMLPILPNGGKCAPKKYIPNTYKILEHVCVFDGVGRIGLGICNNLVEGNEGKELF